MRKIIYIGCLLLTLIIPFAAYAHPGRTDKHGGHTEKATGQYHIHNPDGTITYTTKPEENKKSSTTTQSQPEPNNETTQTDSSVQTNTQEQNTPPPQTQPETDSSNVTTTQPSEQTVPASPSTSTVVVGGSTKQLQPEVTESLPTQEAQTEAAPPSTRETIYQYKVFQTPFLSLNSFLQFILIFFAIIGICMVSSVVHLALKKIEGKSQNVDFFLYIPFIIVIIPSIFGNWLFKLYSKLKETSTPQNQSRHPNKKDDFI